MKLWDLKFWETGEYQVIREHLDDLRKQGTMICPQRKEITRALRETPFETCKVAIFGQDPYPNPAHAMGVSFSIPDSISRNDWPPTLVNVFKEYMSDLHYPEPRRGNLLPWTKQGVLLWNVIPSCTAYRSLSHDWPEWEFLNVEIIEKLSQKDEAVFVFLGGVARRYAHLVDRSKHTVCEYSHPSPRANLSSKTPFLGSRMFSTINSHLKTPIDWKLP